MKDKVFSFGKTFPMVKVFRYGISEFLVYDAKANFMFLLDESEFQVLMRYVKDFDAGACIKIWPDKCEVIDKFVALHNAGVFLPGPFLKLGASERESVARKVDYFCDNIFMRKYVLDITERCNYRCRYCFNSLEPEFRHTTMRQMSKETARKAVDYYKALYLSFYTRLNEKKKSQLLEIFAPCLGIYGGEPTLNWDVVTDAVSYYKSLDWPNYGIDRSILSVTINTNLSHINDSILSFLVDNDVILFASLDGPKSENDKNRIFPDGTGTFDVAYENLMKIKYFNEKYYHEKVSILAVEADNADAGISDEFLKGLGCQIQHLPQAHFGCFVYDPEAKTDEMERFSDEYISERMLEIDKYYGVDEDRCLAVLENLYFLDAIKTDSPVGTDSADIFLSCPMGVDNILIGVSGDMHICHKTDGSMPFGNIYNGIDRERLIDLYRNYIKTVDCQECRSCWAIHNCGCCAAMRMRHGEFRNPDIRECDFYRKSAELNFLFFIEVYKKYPDLVDKLLARKKDPHFYRSIVDYNEFIKE